MTKKSEYPEHEKLNAVKAKSQAIGEFLEWLQHERFQRVTLCLEADDEEEFYPFHYSTEHLLAEFFKIDLNKIEAEKRAMLETMRKANAINTERA
jgi:hypothetical protein